MAISKEDLIKRNKARVETEQNYIENRTNKNTGSSCWFWTGSVGNDGYGKAKRHGKTIRAHRLVYAFYKGAIPTDLFVCHSCDRPLCVNPDHLWSGTHAENELDKTNKGRRSPSPSISHKHLSPKGSSHHKAKLTDNDVLNIFSSFESGTVLAKRYKVAKNTIYRIKNKKGWTHLTSKSTN